MRKIHTLMVLLVAVLSGVISAHGARIAVEWNEPDACILQTERYQDGIPLDVPAGATSYIYDAEGSVYFYILAKEGFKFESVTVDGVAKTPMVRNGIIYWGEFFGASADVTVIAKLTRIERDSSLSIEIENGAAWIGAEFNDGYSVPLQNGANSVCFDAELEKSLTLTCLNGVRSFYSITLNGQELQPYTPNANYYMVDPVNAGDKLVIRVFEDAEPVLTECSVTLKLPAGFEDCVYSVRDWTASKFLDFVDGKLTVNSGTDLAINFREEDYTYTGFLINGNDAMEMFRNNSLRFTVEENTTVVVEGTVTEYDDVVFDAYIANPEGVILYCGAYQQNPADLSEGTAIGDDITINDFTMTPLNTVLFEIPVSSKRPMIYVAPKEGYYISTVQVREGQDLVETGYIDGNNTTTFYVVAKKLDYADEAKVNIVGNANSVILRANSRKSQLWDNPVTTYILTEGENTVRFIPEYDLPFTLIPVSAPDNFGIYLDGAPLSPNDDGVYVFNVYYPAEGETQTVESVVTVAADGKPMRTSRTVVKCEEGISANFFYGAVRNAGTATGQMLLVGTPITIVPSSTACNIKAGNAVVNGYDSEGQYIYGLNEAGEYETTTGTANVTYTVSAGAPAPDVTGVLTPGMDTDTFTVIGIDGRTVLKDVPSSGLQTLEKGLYIVNGKKVSIN